MKIHYSSNIRSKAILLGCSVEDVSESTFVLIGKEFGVVVNDNSKTLQKFNKVIISKNREFIVTDNNGLLGLLNKDGELLASNSYDMISIADGIAGLYSNGCMTTITSSGFVLPKNYAILSSVFRYTDNNITRYLIIVKSNAMKKSVILLQNKNIVYEENYVNVEHTELFDYNLIYNKRDTGVGESIALNMKTLDKYKCELIKRKESGINRFYIKRAISSKEHMVDSIIQPIKFEIMGGV